MGPAAGCDGSAGRPVIAFVHIQKTAGTSMKFILKNSFGIRHCDVNPVDPTPGTPFSAADLAFVRRVHPALASISGHEIIEPTRHLAGRVLPYTMLREPVARALSHLQDKNLRGPAPLVLDDYLADPANHDLQVRRIAGGPDLDEARRLLEEAYLFVGLAERFDASMRAFAALCPWPLDLRARVANVAASDHIRRRLEEEPEVMARVAEANRLDAELYAWVAAQLFPRLLARAGVTDAAPLPGLPPGRPAPCFVACRLWHKLVYRPLLKGARRRRGHPPGSLRSRTRQPGRGPQ